MVGDKALVMVDNREIQSMIYTFRGRQVMIDRDLAYLYNVETKALNQAVKRNISRFPESFRFQISDDEKDELVTNCDLKFKWSWWQTIYALCLHRTRDCNVICCA